MSAQNFTALVLNLDRDTVRFDHMCKQLARARVAFTRLSGVWGDAMPDDLRPYFYNTSGTLKSSMKRGEIGCYASHLRALQRIANGEFGGVVLVMEDDLEVAPDLIDLIADICHAAPSGWDIIRLSNPPRRAYVPLWTLTGNRFLVRYSKIPTSGGAYMITPAGAQKFLQQGVRGLTFDDDLRRPWFHHLETFGVVPPPILAGAMDQSSIDAVEGGRFDKGVSSRRERLMRGDHFFVFKRMAYNMTNMGVISWLACVTINGLDMLVKLVSGCSIIHRAARLFRPGARHG